MSANQSRGERSEGQLRRAGSGGGRSGGSSHHPRGYSGRGAAGPAPQVSSAAVASQPLSTNRSFKKSSNVHGGQSRVTYSPIPESGGAPAPHVVVQNGVHAQAASHGSFDALATNDAKVAESFVGRNSRAVPRAPSSQTTGASDPPAPTTPAKGDASKQFTLQFGTISPGIVKGMQIPARTSSAPPNLDEQKRDQARHDSFRAVPTLPIPSTSKPQPQQTRKDTSGVNQSNSGEPHPPTQIKRDVHSQISAVPASAVPKSSTLPVAGMSMPMPFQQPQMTLQFGGPSPQMHSQGVAASSLQMQMTLPVGNAPQVPQQMYLPLPSHPLQPQAMMHQSHGLGFPPQMGHQLPPQLGNMGIAIAPQFPVQQPGKLSGQQRKSTAVKITHPETHEELRLDKRTDAYSDVGASGHRPLPNLTSQSQPGPAFTPSHQINYYPPLQPNSYNHSPLFYPNPTSLPMTSTQMTSGLQASRYPSYPVGQSGQTMSFINHSVLNPMTGSKPMPSPMHSASEGVNLEALPIPAPPAPIQVTIKPAVSSITDKVGMPPVTISRPISKVEVSELVKQSGESSVVDRIATSSVMISSPLVRDEVQKSLKPHGEVSVVDKIGRPSVVISKPESPKSTKPSADPSIHQQRSIEIAIESSAGQQKCNAVPSDNNSFLIADKQSGSSSVLSVQRIQPETSLSSVPVAGDCGSVMSGNDGRKKEPIRRSDSLKDHQKKTSKRDTRHTQQQQQPDESDSLGAIEVLSLTTPKDSTVSDLITLQDDRNSENYQVLSGTEAYTPAMHSSYHSVENSISSEAKPLDTAKDEAKLSMSDLSGIVLEKETSQDVSSDSSGFSETIKTEVSEVEASATSVPSAVESKCEKIDSSLIPDDHHELMAIDHKQENLATSASPDSSINNVKVHPVSSVSELSEAKSDLLVNQGGSGSEIFDKVIVRESDPERQQIDVSKKEEVYALEVRDMAKEADKDAIASSESDTSARPQSASTDEDITSPCSTMNRPETTCSGDIVVTDLDVSYSETAFTPVPALASSASQKLEDKVSELSTGAPSGMKEKSSLETTRAKTTAGKRRKKRDMHCKADAAGTSDLYSAYKTTEEKHEAVNASETTDSFTQLDEKLVPADSADKFAVASEEDGQGKTEVDDWEDAADISTPKLKTSEYGQHIHGPKKHHENDNEALSRKKYSRDFLLTFSEQCRALPFGFEIGSNIADALMSVPVGTAYVVDREPHPSSGRIIDRSPGASRVDRRTAGAMDDDRWVKMHGSFGPGRDLRVDVGHGAAVVGSRPIQGVNHGVLRNLRGQSSSGGILSGPMQPLPSQGAVPRHGADADRWQRGSGIQRGLIPSPQGPLQVMHKAALRYEVGKAADEEAAKQRQVKGILNKLTPQNFEKLFAQVKEVNIDNTVTLTGVISQIFDKALTEPTFCEMYANFCFHLAGVLPDFSEDNEKITFKRLLLNKCQEEFERGEREQAEASNTEEEGEVKQSEAEKEEKRLKARRRMLGNIRLIGELYKKKMLTERIMHECIKKLLGQYQNPDEEDIEALCKLMSTIGEMIDHPKAKEHMDAYFDRMLKLSNNQKLSSRVRFMLKDAIDLRRNKWQHRRKVEGPKKIEEVHRDAVQERAQAGRVGRGPVMNSSARRGPPMDYGPRVSSVLPSPISQQMGGARGFPSQVRGYGSQDVRSEDRHPSVPLPQKTIDDASITLGPQGGLARGMSIRGQPLMPNVPFADSSPSTGDSRKILSGPNGHSSASDRTLYNSREETIPRYMSDRFAGASNDQQSPQDRNTSSGNRDAKIVDRTSERSSTSLSVGQAQGSVSGSQTATSEARPLSEEVLREKSISTIREFYSAKDEDEVVLCVRELNAPSFFPAMVSLWVTDSFERKDMERDLLTGLLVKLSKSQYNLLSQVQLIQGFESVLSSLEDAVNDAPRAAEFLGRIFSKIILENVVPFSEIGRLIHEGGEEPGRLLEIGLAADVLGSTLEFIQAEKGDLVLKEIRTRSNLRLEDFRPPYPMKSKKLDAYL